MVSTTLRYVMNRLGEDLLHSRDKGVRTLRLVYEARDVQLTNGWIGIVAGDKRAQDQDRRVPEPGTFPDLLEDLEACHLGQHQVEQDQTRVLVVDEAKRLFAIPCCQDVVASGGQEFYR